MWNRDSFDTVSKPSEEEIPPDEEFPPEEDFPQEEDECPVLGEDVSKTVGGVLSSSREGVESCVESTDEFPLIDGVGSFPGEEKVEFEGQDCSDIERTDSVGEGEEDPPKEGEELVPVEGLEMGLVGGEVSPGGSVRLVDVKGCGELQSGDGHSADVEKQSVQHVRARERGRRMVKKEVKDRRSSCRGSSFNRQTWSVMSFGIRCMGEGLRGKKLLSSQGK